MARDTARERPPQQDRSKLSLERLVSSAINLLSQRGSHDFTLQDVCVGAGLSIGAVYSRFANKDDLLHMVQARVIDMLDSESDAIFVDLSNWEAPFHQWVPVVVKEFAGMFRKHDAILRPMMARAALDPIMAAAGLELDARMASRFRQLILRHRNEIAHKNPERAVDACFDVVFASVTRFLGLGTPPNIRGKGSWQAFVEDLGMMASSFLIYNPEGSVLPDRKVRDEGLPLAKQTRLSSKKALGGRALAATPKNGKKAVLNT